jgi:hypothetical protein
LRPLRQRAARFRAVALHLHSPESFDWGRSGAKNAQNEKIRFDGEGGPSIFGSEQRGHLELAAITDHMRCDFAARVSAEVGSNDDFVVLPGMEVNFIPGVGLMLVANFVCLRPGSPLTQSESRGNFRQQTLG